MDSELHQLEFIGVSSESFLVDVFAFDGRCRHGSGCGMRGRTTWAEIIDQPFISLAPPHFKVDKWQ